MQIWRGERQLWYFYSLKSQLHNMQPRNTGTRRASILLPGREQHHPLRGDLRWQTAGHVAGQWHSFKSPLKSETRGWIKAPCEGGGAFSRQLQARGGLYLIQPVVVDGDVVQPHGLFDVLEMRLGSGQRELILVHVRNVLQDVVLPSLGNNLLEHKGHAMQRWSGGVPTLTRGCQKDKDLNTPHTLANTHWKIPTSTLFSPSVVVRGWIS